MNRVLAIAAVSSVGLLGCTGRSFDSTAEQAILLKRDAEWASLAAANQDVDKIISYWSADAVVIPPGQPAIEGKAALKDFVTATQKIPGFRIHWVSDRVSFSPDGKFAYMHGRNETTLNGPDGKPMTIPGRGITVWRKEADGQWRCVIDIWNEPPSPAKSPNPQ